MSTAIAVPQENASEPKQGRRVHLTRNFRTSRERVYEAWADPDQMKQWMGPTGFVCVVSQAEVRAGGQYRLSMRGPHTSTGQHPAEERISTATGEYLEVRPPEFLQFTWRPDWAPGEESVVTVQLFEEGDGTRLELTHEGFATEQSEAGHSVGWNGSMEKLGAFLER